MKKIFLSEDFFFNLSLNWPMATSFLGAQVLIRLLSSPLTLDQLLFFLHLNTWEALKFLCQIFFNFKQYYWKSHSWSFSHGDKVSVSTWGCKVDKSVITLANTRKPCISRIMVKEYKWAVKGIKKLCCCCSGNLRRWCHYKQICHVCHFIMKHFFFLRHI